MSRFRDQPDPPAFPEALYDEMGSAAERALELESVDRELHFATDAAGRLSVELRTAAGRVLTRVSAVQALEIVSGCDLDEGLGAAGSRDDELGSAGR